MSLALGRASRTRGNVLPRAGRRPVPWGGPYQRLETAYRPAVAAACVARTGDERPVRANPCPRVRACRRWDVRSARSARGNEAIGEPSCRLGRGGCFGLSVARPVQTTCKGTRPDAQGRSITAEHRRAGLLAYGSDRPPGGLPTTLASQWRVDPRLSPNTAAALRRILTGFPFHPPAQAGGTRRLTGAYPILSSTPRLDDYRPRTGSPNKGAVPDRLRVRSPGTAGLSGRTAERTRRYGHGRGKKARVRPTLNRFLPGF